MKQNIRQTVFEKYDGKCAYCGLEFKSIKDMQVDHIIAQRNMTERLKNLKTDINDISNLNPSCRSCNRFKDTFTLEQFRKNIEYQIQKFRSYHATFRIAEKYGVITCNENEKVVFHFEKEELADDSH